MYRILTILQRYESAYDVDLNSKQRDAALGAMRDYAMAMIDDYRQSLNKDAVLEGIRLIPALLKGKIILWLRKRFFMAACREAQIRADTEGYHIYVLRSTNIAYRTLSTLEVDENKKLRIFGKQINSLKLHKLASYVAKPNKVKL